MRRALGSAAGDPPTISLRRANNRGLLAEPGPLSAWLCHAWACVPLTGTVTLTAVKVTGAAGRGMGQGGLILAMLLGDLSFLPLFGPLDKGQKALYPSCNHNDMTFMK